MLILLTIVHVIVCIFLIIVVLLQSGKAADLAGAFGGMGSQTAFGPRGSATMLSQATTAAAILFMVTSLSLSILATRTAGVSRTVLDSSGGKQTVPAKSGAVPVKPAKPAGVRARLFRSSFHQRGKVRRRRLARPRRRNKFPRGGGGIGRRTSLRC